MRIFCFGASNTYGFDPQAMFGGRYDKKDRWTNILSDTYGFETINVGLNGREIPKGEFEQQSFCAMIKAREPLDAVIVMLGTNDILMGASADETNELMRAFLLNVDFSREKIMLAVPPPMKMGTWVSNERYIIESRRLSKLYMETAKEMGTKFFDPGDIELAYDGVHMTAEGNHIFARRIYEKLSSDIIPFDD